MLKRHETVVTYLFNRSDVRVSVLKPGKELREVLCSSVPKHDAVETFRSSYIRDEGKYNDFASPRRRSTAQRRYREQIAKNIKLTWKKFAADYGINMKQLYPRVGEVLEIKEGAVRNIIRRNRQKDYPSDYRSITAEEILIFEKEFGIDRDDILGRRNSPYPRRSVLRELDTLMKEDDEVEEQVSNMLNHIKRELADASRQGKWKICTLIHDTLNQYNQQKSKQNGQ